MCTSSAPVFEERWPPVWLPSRASANVRVRLLDDVIPRSKEASLHLAITFVDWAPAPHDANLGMWRGVDLTLVPNTMLPVTIRYPQVATTLRERGDAGAGGVQQYDASFEVMAEVRNWGTTHAINNGLLCLQLGSSIASTAAQLPQIAASETIKVVLNLTAAVTDADLWWPWQMGEPVTVEIPP